MASRSRGHGSQRDWDSMREDFDNSNYDSQYPDDSSSDLVKLDHCRLYITNIPKALNEEGLRAAFSKYGTLNEAFINKDPLKRYGLVSFETAGEARHAMMKLNKTEPLGLNISIAHEQKKNRRDNARSTTGTRERDSVTTENREKQDRNREIDRDRNRDLDRERNMDVDRERNREPERKESASFEKRKNRNKEMANGDNVVHIPEMPKELEVDMESLDPEIQERIEKLQIEQLKLLRAELACQQRLLVKQGKKARCVLPDGKIYVRNVTEGNADHRDDESSFAAGGGDSLNIPGLQRARCRECVSCGDAADSFCARCGVTPYCSARCQRRDWVERHSAVCHNLARLKEVQDVNGAVEQVLPVPIIAPLRRPHSPARRELAAAREAAPKEPVSEGREDNSGKKFIPSGQRNRDAGGRNFSTRDGPNRPLIDRTVKPERSFDKQETSFDNPERSFDKQDKSFDKQDRSFDKPERSSDKPNRSSDKPNRSSDNKDRQAPRQDRSGQESGTKPFRKPQGSSGGEDWGAKGHRRQNPDQAHKVNLLLLKANGIRNVLNLQQLANRTNSETVEQMDEESGASKPQPSVTPTKPEPKVPPMNTSSPVKTPIKQTPVVRAANQRESASPANQNAAMSPAANQKEVKPPAANAKPPGDATDVTPSRKLVPKNCVIETLSIGDTILLSVDAVASECQTKSTGFICLSLHENFEADYQALCEDFGVACEAEKQAYTPKPGETFSLFNPEDGGWYRARCLSPTQAALIDSSKVVPLTPAGKYTRLPEKYQNIPEFCCLLQANVTVGESLKCVILEKTANGMKVSVEESDGDGSVSSGEASRWLPIVQAPAATAAPIPVVPRPPLVSNSAVFLVHFTNCSDFFVRSAETAAQKKFDDALHDTALYGLSATPLTEPPTMGQYVVSKYTDGLHYRALVKRTNVRQNKYLLEYLDYGNSHINTLENLYPCPATLQPDKMAVMTSQCALLVTSSHPLTPPAEAMLEKLKDDSVELVLTLPYDEQSSPNGSKVTLTVAKNKQSVNKKVEDLITPDWVKLEKSGGDVIETESVMFSELEYLDLPPEGCEVLVLDCGTIEAGIVSGCRKGEAHAVYVLTTLTEKINKYCESELGKEPYLPKAEELCIAQLPPYDQWFRAVLAEQVSGPGGAEAEVCYIDYGNMERVPVSLLRKMLPEFVRGQPALANTLTIKDFPEKPTAAMLERALKHLSLNDEGQGTLVVTRCEKEQPGLYTVSAPALIAAMKGAQ